MDKNSDQTLHDDVTTGQIYQIETFHESSDEAVSAHNTPESLEAIRVNLEFSTKIHLR